MFSFRACTHSEAVLPYSTTNEAMRASRVGYRERGDICAEHLASHSLQYYSLNGNKRKGEK